MTNQKFGGPWTVEKLEILTNYLYFYHTALKNKSFDLLYIDAFAGTGKIKIGDDDEFEIIDGSAKLALQSGGNFAEYNDCATEVVQFCEERGIAYHIKNGTISE